MKRTKLLCILFILTVIMVYLHPTLPFSMEIDEAKAEIQYVDVVPIDDARVYEGSPGSNFGSSDYMTVGRDQSNHMEMWIRFNLTDVASTYDNLKLKSAVLRLRRTSTYGTIANVQVQVWATETSWSESSITWNNKPSLLTNYTSCAFTGNKFSETAFRRVPLNKNDVEYWMSSSEKLYSICMTAQNQTDTDAYLAVFTKESVYDLYLDLYFAPEGAESNSQVAVLVDTTIQDSVPGYFELFAKGVEKWLEWWKMDYEEIDLRTTPVTQPLLSSYNLILIGQFNLTMNGNLDSSELQAINASVYDDGVGLVQLDPYLTGYTDIWSAYNELFGVAVQGWVSSSDKMNLTVVDNTHFITEIYRNGTQMNALFGEESDLAFENVTVGSSTDVSVVMPYNGTNSPAFVVKSHGNGRTVLSTFSTGRVDLGIFAGIDGFGERPLRTNSGMHGLLWRSMVWTAKKPFAFMGMPPFLTFRMESVGESSNLDYIDKLVEHGLFVHLNIFADDVYRRGSAYWNRLKNYYWNGTVHIAPRSWNHNWLIYWNQTGNKEYDLSTLSKYFDWLDGNQTAWNITFSAWRIPHFCAVGENAVPYLLDREWNLIGCKNNIPFNEGSLSGTWMWDSPQRRCVVVMDFADENDTIFDVLLLLPVNNATYFTPSALYKAYNPPNVTKGTEQMLAQLEHGLADLFWGETFTHEAYAVQFGASNWDTLLTQVIGNITRQYPFYITASNEYIARYVFNRRHLSISNRSYSGNTLTLNFSGTTNLPTAFYLFTDQKISSYSGILDQFRSYGNDGYLVWIPAHSGNLQVSITLGSSETNNPRIHYTTANVTSTSSSTSGLVINAQQIWKHTKLKYFFEINCTDLGQPKKVTVDTNTILYDYDDSSKLARFNVTFQGSREIQVSWNDTSSPVVSVLSPESGTYGVGDVPLTFTVDKPTSWIGYSLDGGVNVTVAGNTTLLGLSDGLHYVVVYANDTAGNMGVSQTVYFAVDTTAPRLFEDGFEGYDFGSGEWNGTETVGGAIDTDAVVDPYSGSEHAISSMNGAGSKIARVYKDFADETEFHCRAYFKVVDEMVDSSDERYTLMELRSVSPSTDWLALVQIWYYGVETRWRLAWMYGSGSHSNTYNATAISLDTWYCVELAIYVNDGNGNVTLWIDGVKTIQITGIDNDYRGGVDRVLVGLNRYTYIRNGGNGKIYVDNVICDNKYIGTEGGEPDATPPVVSVLSPESGTYGVGDVPLTFTVSEKASWIGYSLDGGVNVTVAGNTTLLGLSDGLHYVVVYANDTAGNMGVSETVYFTVDITPPNIAIVSPENKTYYTSAVDLLYIVDEPASWIGYSLDGAESATLTGNTTLSGLYIGSHSLTVYANDTAGNWGVRSVLFETVSILGREVFSVISNSTISALNFSSQNQILEFNVSGPSGTIGYTEVVIAKTLMENASDLEVYLDSEEINYTLTSTGEAWVVYFEYEHSVHTVRIVFSTAQTAETTPLATVLLTLLPLMGAVLVGVLLMLTALAIFRLLTRKRQPYLKQHISHSFYASSE